MTLTEKFNKRFPNEDVFMEFVEAHMVEDDSRNISPRPSFCAGSLNMAMEMRMGAGVREARAPYGARPAKGKK